MAESKKSKANAEAAAAARAQNISVGATLRAARVAKGLELEEVSSTIHIRAVQLKAIEDNNIEALPGMTYAVGFVRSYANFLGLNGSEIVHKFKAEHGHAPAPSSLSFPEPVAESRMPDPIMVGVGAFMAVIVLILWTVYSNMSDGDDTAADQIPPAPIVATTSDMPEEIIPAAPVAETTAVGVTPPVAAAPAAPAVAAAPAPAADESSVGLPPPETPAGTPEAAIEVKPQKTESAPEKKTPVKAAKEEEAPAEDEEASDSGADGVIKVNRGKSRIVLEATQPTWVQITNEANQDVIYRKVLRPGEKYYVPDEKGLSLVTANAGGLEIYVDGQIVQDVGRPGEIVRGVILDPSHLKKKRIRVRN